MLKQARPVGLAGRRRRQGAHLVAGLPDLLERTAGGLRAGVAPGVALAEAAGAPDVPAGLAVDLARLLERADDIGLGPALDGWAEERPLPAVAAVCAAVRVTDGAGGPGAAALDGLAAGLRDHHDTAAEVTALSAQARLSAIVVGAAPVVSLALSLLADRRVAPALFSTTAGRVCLIAGVALDGLAALWMGRILRGDGPRRVARRPPDGRWAAADLALAADLLALASAAGLTPYLALEVVGRSGPAPLAGRLRDLLAEAAAGRRLSEVLEAEAGRSPALAPLLTVLGATERSGAPAGPGLTRLAAATRAQARRRAMARARTVPVRLLFPLVFLVLPAFLVLTVAPIVLAGLR